MVAPAMTPCTDKAMRTHSPAALAMTTSMVVMPLTRLMAAPVTTSSSVDQVLTPSAAEMAMTL